MILQSHALKLRFDTSVIYKRQADVAGEPLRAVKTKEPRQAAWRPSVLPEQRGWQRPRRDERQSVRGKGELGPHTLGSALN